MRNMYLAIVLLFFALPLLAHPGIGIVRDSRGNIFYTDLHHVWKISPDGTRTIAVPNVHTHELCVDTQDNLYGEHLWYEGERTDKWGYRVWRRSPDGTLVDVIPARDGFLQNYSFIRDRAGTMYWADRGAQTVIRRRTPDGAISVHAEGDFQDVRWMMTTAGGVLYLIDGPDLRKITYDGSVTTIARDPKERGWFEFVFGSQHNIMGLWADSAGNVYVAVYGGRVVKKVEPSGGVSVVARSRAPWSPTGGLVAPNGDLWLLEYSVQNTARVRHIRKDGTEKSYG